MANSLKKVLIVIPCYNDGKYLRQAFDSARNQTYQNIEIVIVNDGSTDKQTLSILDEMAAEGINVAHKENGHLSSARNFGIRLIESEFIFPLDSDDYIDNSFIELGVKILHENPKIGVVTSYIQTFGDSNKIWKPLGGGIKNVIVANRAACGNSLYRRECWIQADGYDEKMKNGCEDWEFWIGVLKKGWFVHVIKKAMFHYRITNKSMRLNMKDKYLDNIEYIVAKHRDVFQANLEFAIIEREKQLFELSEFNTMLTNRIQSYEKSYVFRILRRLFAWES